MPSTKTILTNRFAKAEQPLKLLKNRGKQQDRMTENATLASLIAGCRQQKEASQLALYKHFYSYGMSVCLRFAKSRENAMEILNDGFLKVFKKIEQYDTQFAFKPWLRKILVNAAIDYYRKYEEKEVITTTELVKENSTYNDALDQLAYDDLLLLMQELPAAYRMVFNLYVIEGMKHSEIAEELNISVGTSKSNLAKARLKIKALLVSTQGFHFKN